MASLTPAPKAQFFDANGNPLVGGKLYSYSAGTTTPLATYVDQTQTATNTNPVILDSRGEANVWLAVASYKLRLTDANNVEIWTVDNIVTDDVAVLSDLALPGGATLVGYSPGPDSLLGVVPITVAAALDNLSDEADGSSYVGFLQAGTNAVPRTAQSKMRDVVSVLDFGADPTGGTDSTDAIQDAVNAATANRANEVHFPVGEYVISGTITLTSGIRLIGQGAMGAQTAQGAVLVHKANSVNMLVWDGSNPAGSRGTGGGIFNFQCVKYAGYSGGDAIKLLAISDSLRPGEFTVENVLVWKGDGGVWSRGFHVDGTAASTPGSKGVRSIKMDKLRVADCSVNNEYIYLNQAVHVVSEYLQIDTGSGTGTAGMTIAGDSDNIILNGLILNGNLIIGGSSNMNVALSGRVSVLDVNNTAVLGAANIQSTAITNAATNFSIVSNVTDAFMATLASTVSNVTGDNTTYNVVFDTEIFDTAGSFSGATFTAKCAGRYLFTWCVGYTGLTSSHTRQDTGIVQRRIASTIQSIQKVSNPYAQGSNGGLNFSEAGSCELTLLEGDTVEVTANVSGGTKVVDILGASTRYTWFSGKYLA